MDTTRGALVHFSEEMYMENVTTTTPWIALISCEVTPERNESTIEREFGGTCCAGTVSPSGGVPMLLELAAGVSAG